jgi:hypothetical protein
LEFEQWHVETTSGKAEKNAKSANVENAKSGLLPTLCQTMKMRRRLIRKRERERVSITFANNTGRKSNLDREKGSGFLVATEVLTLWNQTVSKGWPDGFCLELGLGSQLF